MVKGPLVAVRGEGRDPAAGDGELVVQVVGADRRVEDADVGANPADPEVGDPPLAEVVVEVGVGKGLIAVLGKELDPVAVPVGLVPVTDLAVEVLAWRPDDVVGRKELRLRMEGVV